MKRFLSVAVVLAAGFSAATLRADTVTLTSASATFSQSGFDISNVITNSNTPGGTSNTTSGWAIDPNEGVSQTAVFGVTGNAATSSEFTFNLFQNFTGGGSNFQHTIGDFLISVTTAASPTFSSLWTNLTNVTATDGLLTDPATVNPTTGEVQFLGASPDTATYTVTGDTTLQNITGIRLEVLNNALLPHDGPGRQPTNGNFVLTALGVSAAATPLPSSAMGGLVLLSGLGAVGFRRCRFA